jgi:hypothetical protein
MIFGDMVGHIYYLEGQKNHQQPVLFWSHKEQTQACITPQMSHISAAW